MISLATEPPRNDSRTHNWHFLRIAGFVALISGIADAFKGTDGKTTPEVDVLLVHGIGDHDPSWIPIMVRPLAVALGFDFDPEAPLPQPEALPNGAQLYQLTLRDANRMLQIIVPLWSPIAAPAKESLCFDVDSSTELCPAKSAWTPHKRAYVNGLIKSEIRDDRLSDVTFYLAADGGERIREAIDDAWIRSLSTDHTMLD